MAADPFQVMNALNSIIGTKQLGPMAPIFQPGTSSFQPMQGLLGDQAIQASQMLNPQNFTARSLEELIGRPETRGQELAPQVTADDQSSIQGITGLPSLTGMAQQQQQAVGDPGFGGEEEPGFFGKLGQSAEGFFGNLDQNLQSPSKVIGLGLLNRIDPRLAGVGLLAGGLLGNRKVF